MYFVYDFIINKLAYTDDMALLAPTPRAMRHLLLICEEYGNKFSIKFNVAKSSWLYFSKGKQPRACFPQFPQFSIVAKLINRASEYTHLGHIISANLDDNCEILSKHNSLYDKINNVMCYFCNRNPVVKLILLRSYCRDFYGSVFGTWHILLWTTFVLLCAKG